MVSDNSLYTKRISIFLVLIMLLQRISIPLSSGGSLGQLKQVPVALILGYVFLIYSMFRGKVTTEIHRMMMFVVIAVLSMTATMFNSKFSMFSLFYLLVIYFIFIFRANISAYEYRKLMNVHQKFMVVFSIVGIAQILVMFAGASYYDIFSILPQKFVQANYNTSYPIIYGSKIYKSNGVVFLEPSFFSQFLAMAIIIEIIYFKKFYRIALYLLGILSSFSGTGIILLLAAFPLLMPKILKSRPLRRAFSSIIILVMITVFLGGSYFLKDYYATRVSEFGLEGSSADMRFVTPYVAMKDIVVGNPIWSGLGAGSVTDLKLPFESNFPAIPKVVIEYGLVFGIIFTFFLIYCFFSKSRSITVSMSAAIMYFILSGSLLQTQMIYYLFFLVVFLPKSDMELM